MVEFLGDARGPVRFYVPLKGFSNHDSTEGHLHGQVRSRRCSPTMWKRSCRAMWEVRRVDAHINDPLFCGRAGGRSSGDDTGRGRRLDGPGCLPAA